MLTTGESGLESELLSNISGDGKSDMLGEAIGDVLKLYDISWQICQKRGR